MTPQTLTKSPAEKRIQLAEREVQLVDDMIRDTLKAPRKHLSARDIEDLIQIKSNNKIRDRKLHGLFSAIAFAVSLLLIVTAFEWKSYDNVNQVDLTYNADNFEEIAEIPLTEQPPPPPPSNTVQILFNEVPDEEIIEEIQVDLDVEITTEMTVSDEIYNPFDDEPMEEEAEEIFTIVEEQPTPKGGYAGFYASLRDNLRYPDLARRAGVEGKVFLQFIVRPDGDISNIVTAKGIGYGCDEAATEALKAGPRWNPGKQRGRPVMVRVIVPIVFKLAK